MSKQICNCCHEHKEHKSWKAYTCNDCLDKGLKYCPSCDSTQPISNFYKNGHTIRSYCKECENIRSLNNKQVPDIIVDQKYVKNETKTVVYVKELNILLMKNTD